MVDLTGSVLYEKINIGVKPGIVVNRARHARYFRLGKIVPYGRITRILDLLSDAKKKGSSDVPSVPLNLAIILFIGNSYTNRD